MIKYLGLTSICRQNILNEILQDDMNVTDIFRSSLFRFKI
mgnify:CR=1 FL=1